MVDWLAHKLLNSALGILAVVVAMGPNPLQAAVALTTYQNAAAGEALNWQSSARWRHGLTKTPGTLAFNARGVEFQAAKGQRLHWPFEEIQTFELLPHRLQLTGYANRKWHLQGERSFLFDLTSAVPPEVAASLARRVGKPVKNADPSADAPAIATLPARHRTRGGGTNGVLRFRKEGIDYVTADGRGARSWRWQDIHTIANPDPYRFRVDGYREIFSFELKQPMNKKLFDRLWNDVYAGDLRGLEFKEGARQ